MKQKQPPERSQEAPHGTGPDHTWEQRSTETARAYQAFLAFRDMGPARTVAAAARELGRSAALLYRWSRQHAWSERAYAWDLICHREQDAAVREAREKALQRQAQDADRLQRLAMARLGKVLQRDSVTGELTLDPDVTVQDAVRVYKLGLDIERALTATSAESAQDETSEQDDDLRRMSDAELHQLIELARGRAGKEADDVNDDD